MASARRQKRQSLDGPSQETTPARSKKRKMSAPLGPPWSPSEIDAFFHGQQQHRSAWGMIAGLVRTRTPEQCEALFNLNKTYLSLPDGAKSVQGLAALMTDHFNAMEAESEPESSTGAREKTPEPAPRRGTGGTPKRSPGQLPRPAKRARTVVPVGRRTPRPPPQPLENGRGDLLRTPPRATRSLTADTRSPMQGQLSAERRSLRPRDVSRSPIKDRSQRSGGGQHVVSPEKGGKVLLREGGTNYKGLKQIMKALEVVEEEERKGEGAKGGASPPRKKHPHALSKKAHILAKVQAQRAGGERSESSGEEKGGSQAELMDNASSAKVGGEGKSSEEEGPPREEERAAEAPQEVRVESEAEEDVPIMKRLDLASPKAERRPLKKRKGEVWAVGGDPSREADSGSEATRSDELPIIAGGRDSRAVTSKRANPQKKDPPTARKAGPPVTFQGPASGLDVLSSVVVAGDGLHSPQNMSTSASPVPPPPEVQSTAKSRLPPRTPPRTPSSTVKLRPTTTPPRPKPSPAKPKLKPKSKATSENAPPLRAASPDDSAPDEPILPAKPKEKGAVANPPPSPKAVAPTPQVSGSPGKKKGSKTPVKAAGGKGTSGTEGGVRSEDAPLVTPERKRKRKPGVEKLPPVPPLPEVKEPEKKPRPKPRPRPPPSSPPPRSSAPAQPAGSSDKQENTPIKARNQKKPARPAPLSGGPRLGPLTFTPPTPPRPPAHCSHTDHPEGPSQSRQAQLLHCLNSRVRRWCLYEWFCSALDYPWFARNEFVEYLEHAGLGGVKRLSRTEWGVIRSSLGHPRRLSRVFLREEREKLAAYRESTRAAYAEASQGGELPAELPAPLAVGQRVTAKHPKTRQIAEGAILTVDNKGRSRVQFDKRELASEIVQDIDMMPLEPLQNMPAALKKRRLEMLAEASTGDHTPGELLVLRLEPLMAAADSTLAVALAKQATAEAMSAALAEPATPPASPRLDPAAQAAREKDVKVLADLQRALDKKANLLSEMAQLTVEAERRGAEASSSGDTLPTADGEAPREALANKVLALEQINKQVEQFVLRLRQRNRYPDPHNPTWVHANGSPGPSRGGVPPVPREDLQPKPIGEMAAGARRQARAMVAQVVAALQSAGEGEDPMLVLEALGPNLGLDDKYQRRLPPGGGASGAAGPHAIPGILGTSRAAGKVNWAEAAAAAHSVGDTGYADPQRSKAPAVPGDPLSGLAVGGHSHSKEGGYLSELMASCVATLLMIQTCTDRALPHADVVLTLDSAIASLKPHSQHNQRVWKEIETCINTIKAQILTQIPYQQAPLTY